MNNIKVKKILPDAILQQYVDSYIFREVDTDGITVKKIIPPNHVTSLDFFMGAPFNTIDIRTEAEIPYKTAAIRGCRTTAKYVIEYNKPFSAFSIKLKPTGLFSLLGIEMHKFTDADIDCYSIKLPFDIGHVYQKMAQSTDIDERVNIVESFLVNVLSKKENKSRLSGFIENANDIEAQPIYLSQRQQERLFRKEVGMSPKHFSSLKRFCCLLKAKKQNENLSWTSLAYEHGYFDQAHLIRDFHFFLGMSPTSFRIGDFAL
ncbi:MAG TPA: helix-turn-helix domain-containing protein [Niabella sp.]|jgi:hypothetical protein|nr:helix-turn-helix domain-containing protein [Chitinophagaceae bacterium]HRN49284.1 helix-turn-helix domain-containing protein [Niabella sp.]HRO84823.1 helix-turn-helix domain-containing protein [Niabella sp.]HUN02934.1 helix-turn-helix domain-containing protein [Niabella sp.]